MTIMKIDFDILTELVKLKLVNAYQLLLDKLINIYIWAGCTIFVSGYLMQSFGLSQGFGAFLLGGVLASVGIFELYGNAISFVADLEGDCTLRYYLTLPTHSITVLCSHVIYYTLVSSIVTASCIPFIKMILMDKFDLSLISWPKITFFLILVNLVCAAGTLLVASLVPSMDKFDTLWTRIVFPLWMLGGFQFSWGTVYTFNPILAYFFLLNPFIYMSEGMRNALLGNNETIPFWICSAVLGITLTLFSYSSYTLLKKRLDFV